MEYNAHMSILWSVVAILAIFSFSIAVVSLAVFLGKKAERKKKTFAAPSSEKTEKGVYGGVKYEYGYHSGSKNNPSHFSICIKSRSPGSFKVTWEKAFDIFFKKRGICCEIQTGDPLFDDHFYLDTETVDFTRAFFNSADKREVVAEIFQKGFTCLIHDGETMAAVWSPFPNEREFGENLVPEILPHLVRLSEQMPKKATPLEAADPGWRKRRRRAIAIPAVLLLAGLQAIGWSAAKCEPLDGWRMFFASLIVSVPLPAIYIRTAIGWIKGRAASHWDLIFVLFLSVLAFHASVFGFGMFANGMFDISEPTSHIVKVVDKYSKSSSRGGTKYHIVVKSWRGRLSEEFKVNRSEYKGASPGISKMKITTKPGLLGFEWILKSGMYRPRS